MIVSQYEVEQGIALHTLWSLGIEVDLNEVG